MAQGAVAQAWLRPARLGLHGQACTARPARLGARRQWLAAAVAGGGIEGGAIEGGAIEGGESVPAPAAVAGRPVAELGHWGCRAARSRQARPEEAQGASSGSAERRGD